MALLLDTNVLSELRKAKPSYKVTDLLTQSPVAELYISSVTFAEIQFGIELLTDSGRRVALETWLNASIRPMFADRVLQVTEGVMLRWRHLVEEGRQRGRTFSQPDLIIAATALEHHMTLVTRNEKDFGGIGLTVLNPWD